MKRLNTLLFAANIVGLTGFAYVSAMTIGDEIADRLWSIGQLPGPGQTVAGPMDAAAQQQLAGSLAGRAPFGTGPNDDLGGARPPPQPGGAGEVRRSRLPIELVGTAPVQGRPGLSTAVMKVRGETRLAQPGERFDGVTLVAVERGEVLVNGPDGLEVLKLWERRDPPRKEKKAVRKTPRNRKATTGIRKLRGNRYAIRRDWLRSKLRGSGVPNLGARLIPKLEGGRYQGFALHAVRPDSVLRELGLRSGDVLTAVDGTKLDSPSVLLGLYERLQKASQIRLEVMRRNQPRVLEYTLD